MLTLIDSGVIDHNSSHGAYMSDIIPLSDDSFVASQHVGSSLGANDCRIEILQSSDGKTWRNEGDIHSEGPPTRRVLPPRPQNQHRPGWPSIDDRHPFRNHRG